MPEQSWQAPYGELNEKFRVGVRRTTTHTRHKRMPARTTAWPIHDVDHRHPVRQAKSRLDGVGEAALDPIPPDQPVDHDLDRVLFVPREFDVIRELHEVAVDSRPREAGLGEILEQGVVLALSPADHGCKDHELGALVQLEHSVDDLLRRLARDG